MDHPPLKSRAVGAGHCSHLRHKGMYVMAEPDPDEAKYFDRYDAAAYWCACTQTSFGPDGHPVQPAMCCTGRECCRH
jgi:hypothetical protein